MDSQQVQTIDSTEINLSVDFTKQLEGLCALNLYPLRELLDDYLIPFDKMDKKLYIDGEILTCAIDVPITESRICSLVFHADKEQQKVFSYFVSFFQKQN